MLGRRSRCKPVLELGKRAVLPGEPTVNDVLDLFGRKALSNVWPGDQGVAWVVGLVVSMVLDAAFPACSTNC